MLTGLNRVSLSLEWPLEIGVSRVRIGVLGEMGRVALVQSGFEVALYQERER